MKCNVGGNDRTIRLAAGIAAVGVGLFAPVGRVGRIVALAAGGAALFSALTRYCPINEMLGVNTCDALDEAVDKVTEVEDKFAEAADHSLTA